MNQAMDDVRTILSTVLGIGERASSLQADSPLLGGIPEFDSMAVVSVLSAIEEQYGIFIEDDDVSVETFETVGSLASFLEKVRA